MPSYPHPTRQQAPDTAVTDALLRQLEAATREVRALDNDLANIIAALGIPTPASAADVLTAIERLQREARPDYAIKFDMKRPDRRWTALGPDGRIGDFETPEEAAQCIPPDARAMWLFTSK